MELQRGNTEIFGGHGTKEQGAGPAGQLRLLRTEYSHIPKLHTGGILNEIA